ncbi:unnamed protein product [Periconia digitata]|uniref:U6 snRNA-associated Sm-like protein LSm6 n=1 Tax=Periconia digitata TaxID=1303443 RepID=A0A9W4UT51_9PLEO|nr:unnamed protein product [Periconia digitata]
METAGVRAVTLFGCWGGESSVHASGPCFPLPFGDFVCAYTIHCQFDPPPIFANNCYKTASSVSPPTHIIDELVAHLLSHFKPENPANMSTNGESPEAEVKGDSRDPSGFLSEIIGHAVTVKLNSGIVYKGDLQSVDGYMNISLEGCREVAEGRVIRSWGDAFVRGNNGTLSLKDDFYLDYKI